jgi:hypothetical protein
LADFIVDWIGPSEPTQCHAETVWTIHYDGEWCHAGADAAAIITSPAGLKYRYVACLCFALESDRCTNNNAEYKVLILGPRKLRALGVNTCIIKTDSKVVAGQIKKDYFTKEPVLIQYLVAIQSLEHIGRNKNEEADTLAKAAVKGEPLPFDVFYHIVGTPAVRNPKGLQITQGTDGHRIVNLIMVED